MTHGEAFASEGDPLQEPAVLLPAAAAQLSRVQGQALGTKHNSDYTYHQQAMTCQQHMRSLEEFSGSHLGQNMLHCKKPDMLIQQRLAGLGPDGNFHCILGVPG